jgi:hypothetical protein
LFLVTLFKSTGHSSNWAQRGSEQFFNYWTVINTKFFGLCYLNPAHIISKEHSWIKTLRRIFHKWSEIGCLEPEFRVGKEHSKKIRAKWAWNRACVGKYCVVNTSFWVITGFSIQSLSFRNTKISTQARFQHKSDFEQKSFKSVKKRSFVNCNH